MKPELAIIEAHKLCMCDERNGCGSKGYPRNLKKGRVPKIAKSDCVFLVDAHVASLTRCQEALLVLAEVNQYEACRRRINTAGPAIRTCMSAMSMSWPPSTSPHSSIWNVSSSLAATIASCMPRWPCNGRSQTSISTLEEANMLDNTI